MASSTRAPGRRFLPPDPRVEEPYRLTPQLAFRVAILGFLTLAVFAVLFLRLWALQVLAGDKYVALANDNRVRTIRVEAPRGPIVDRNGHVLVTNVAGTRLELWPADLPKTWSAELRELRALSMVTGVPVQTMVAGLRQHFGDPLTPVVVQNGLHRDQIFYLQEHAAEFPGVQLPRTYLRSYPYQSLAAQVLGYVGQIDAQEYKQLRSQGYAPTDSIGQAGIESTYDTYLRGRAGQAQLTVDSLGRPKGDATVQVQPRAGETLRLTLDINLQRAAERALQYGINLARTTHVGPFADGGAIVAMNPNDGSILAMASNPTYEPAVFSTQKSPQKLAPLLNQIIAAKDNFPSLNRAMQVGYPPGSTFKPVTALAAMEEHLLSPTVPLHCTGSLTAYGQVFNNWDPLINQWIDLPTALAISCDTYFYQLGERFYQLPPNAGHPLQGWANRFGLGEPTGIDIPGETTGLMPTPEWRRKLFSPPVCKTCTELDWTWKPGYSIQLAIGQGDLLVTPLQMARLYAMIANGGNLVTPHIAEDVEAGNGGQVLRRFGAAAPEPTGVDPTALSYVRQGLEMATHSPIGTGYGVFGNFPVNIAGKTGSAEKLVTIPGYNPQKLTQSWWCGYGPYDGPQLVVCATIENGGEGGSAAAPAALKVFEQYFGKNGQITSHASD